MVNEATEEEILELLEKNPSFMDDPALKKTIQEKLSEYEDADDLEKEEEADNDENEDVLELQKENREEQEETDQADETDKSGESKDADDTETVDESENHGEEYKSETSDEETEPGAVSYTHVDVYKRQPIYMAMRNTN